MTTRNARDHGITTGTLDAGPTNSLADVPGVSFGQVTLSDGPVQTGVTVIHPTEGSAFEQKCIAACHVINGFGKSVGLMQLSELGQLETPIVLTNTLSVGTASTALVRHMLAGHPAIGDTTGTVNPVVMECNDGAYLNDIRGLHVTEDHVLKALQQHVATLEQGARGAGTGMSCYGLKGGIGSASRRVPLADRTFTLGAATLCNMGRLPNLIVGGRPVGTEIMTLENSKAGAVAELGSIIIILGTNAPLTARQMERICKRATAGLARTGTQFGSGSGDVVLGFTTANRQPHSAPSNPVMAVEMLHEDSLDGLFSATIEVVEEAILNALFAAETTHGKLGRYRKSLSDWWNELEA
ncbi:P1 family peptidase [uncultured Cohaesibacter sp.]|uniref:DmpA family aminopeptidase n=1 Tax=uncultured Cohaesibacter sp. TaxID=1002546 RepID=UPI0029C7D555|nr:P1 family peptidase [uncultured Cohaesibacter sp.]